MANGSGGVGRFGQPKLGWEFFGSELKRHREAAGLTQQELGRRVICSGSYIGQFETAMRKPQLDVAQRVDVELKTDGLFGRMCEQLINNSPFTSYFAEAVYLERLATSVREYAPTFVPGLLQTAAYARAVFLAGLPFASDDEIDSRVATRLERARLLDHPTRPLLWVVLDETALRRKVGGAAVMHQQLTHIASLVSRRRVVMQVLPFEAGAPALGGMLTLMAFEDAPSVAYEEGHGHGGLVDDPALVARAKQSYDLVSAAALSPEESLRLVQSMVKEYVDDQ
ncbi:helix-turn-helix transcriptional regulator [Streptomyces sp. NPDC046261]|uniref:helix-turn-helix domain-containing protein n=1 Tax=Streptomyces sp. NPDC046261 TaxID=3157200 RepID=UPI00340DF6A7